MNSLDLIKELNEAELYEMANIQPNRTGISSIIYATFNGREEGFKHSARVKIKTNEGFIPIQLEPVQIPKSININKYSKETISKINEALEYIKNNVDLFLQHWNGQIDDADLILSLEKRK